MAEHEAAPNPNCKREDCPTCGRGRVAPPAVETRPADDTGVETR